MVQRIIAWASWLVLPLTLLLFVQWPLREWVQAYSRQANDVAQILFALYVAVALTAATRSGVHLAAGHGARQVALWRVWAVAACLTPWALFLLWTQSVPTWLALRQAERFAETGNPGYFLIKLALWLLLGLVVLDGWAALVQRGRRHG